MGEVYVAQGRYESADAMYRRAMSGLEKNRAPDVERAGVITSLADICRVRGRITEAERLYRRALPIWKSLLPPENYAIKLRDLGALYRADGRQTDAREMEENASKILDRSARASGFVPAP
jgi:tetratricopeptide (TPR) repeat protein